MGQVYSAGNPPPPSTKVNTAWTTENVPVTDGSERNMGKDSFLKLLLTQLQNQDPMNPMENTDMTAQLAQFSQLEQLTNVATAVDNMSSYIQAQNQFQTLTMIGKEVKANNNGLSITNGKPDVKGGIDVDEAANITVYILNANKESVRTIEMGNVSAGSYDIDWNGRDNHNKPLPDGYYFFQVTTKNAKGEIMEKGVSPLVAGKIPSVSFDSSGQPVVHMGHAKLTLAQVLEILDKGTLDAGAEDSETTT